MATGAMALILLNWPGPAYSRKIWYDNDTGWHVYRTWYDPEILSSIVALVASLAARWSGRWTPVALGVVAGSALSVVEDGVLILGSGMAGDEVGVWVAATAIAAAMAAVVLLVLRPRSWPLWPVRPLPRHLSSLGGVMLLLSAAIKSDDGGSFLMVTRLAALEPIVTVALAWLAIAAVEATPRLWLSATAITYALVSMVAEVPALLNESPVAFLAIVVGNALVVAGVALAARQPVRPGTGQTSR